MKKILLVSCLIACIYAYNHNSNLQIGQPEYTKIPTKYELGKSVSFLQSKDVMKQIVKNLQKALADDPGTDAILNDYADKIFLNIDKLIIDDGFDPVELPEQHTGFNYVSITEVL